MNPDEPEYKNLMNGARSVRNRDCLFRGTLPKPQIKYGFEKRRQYMDACRLLTRPERSSSTTTSGRKARRCPTRPGAKSALSGISARGSSMLQLLIRRDHTGGASTFPISRL